MKISGSHAVLFMALFANLLFFACNSNDSYNFEPCVDQKNCTGYESCIWAQCHPKCTTDSECPDNLYCHPKGICAECASSSHCANNQACLFGSCETPENNEEYGLQCNSDSDCLNGEICLANRCTPLCTDNSECRDPRSICNPEGHYCVECLTEANCPDNTACVDGICDTQYPDGDLDAEQAENAEDTEEDIISPPLASINEPCSFNVNPALPECDENLECLYNSQISFCSNACETDSDCTPKFENGCCLPLSTMNNESYCLRESFCEMMSK